jgi:hypothetical protein
MKAWLQQKTTIAGLSAIGGALTEYLSGTITWQVALGIGVGGLIATVLPEDTSTAQAVPAVVTALANAVGEMAAHKPAPLPAGTTTTTVVEVPPPSPLPIIKP